MAQDMLNWNEVYAQLMPAGKLEFGCTLQQRYRALVLRSAVVYRIFGGKAYGKLAGVMVFL